MKQIKVVKLLVTDSYIREIGCKEKEADISDMKTVADQSS